MITRYFAMDSVGCWKPNLNWKWWERRLTGMTPWLQLGARGVVMKEAATQLLMKAIRTVMAGEYWIGREAVGDIVEFMRLNASGDRPPKNFGLTKREMDILMTIVAGLSNKEIARKFSLSEDTVKHHLTNIFDKVGVGSRLELALFAINNRITDQPS
jgi:DNA-binding NarL/FixJ family response regulator